MNGITNITLKRCLSPKLAAVAVVSAVLSLGTFAEPASADWDGHHRGGHHNWNGGYYRAPPVVYGSPYGSSYYGSSYYAPPVVYGPSIGVGLPGISIGIR
jgi:hypothetical protein